MKTDVSEIAIAKERRTVLTRRDRPGERGRHEPPEKIRIRKTLSSSTKLDAAYDDDQVEFLRAIDDYKRERNRPFPSWSEVLAVLRSLGYRKVAGRDNNRGSSQSV